MIFTLPGPPLRYNSHLPSCLYPKALQVVSAAHRLPQSIIVGTPSIIHPYMIPSTIQAIRFALKPRMPIEGPRKVPKTQPNGIGVVVVVFVAVVVDVSVSVVVVAVIVVSVAVVAVIVLLVIVLLVIVLLDIVLLMAPHTPSGPSGKRSY